MCFVWITDEFDYSIQIQSSQRPGFDPNFARTLAATSFSSIYCRFLLALIFARFTSLTHCASTMNIISYIECCIRFRLSVAFGPCFACVEVSTDFVISLTRWTCLPISIDYMRVCIHRNNRTRFKHTLSRSTSFIYLAFFSVVPFDLYFADISRSEKFSSKKKMKKKKKTQTDCIMQATVDCPILRWHVFAHW